MKNRKLIIRIIAIFLCALMILSVVTILLNVLAAGPGEVVETGSNPHIIWFGVAACVGVAVAAACIVTSKSKKKNSGSDDNNSSGDVDNPQ